MMSTSPNSLQHKSCKINTFRRSIVVQQIKVLPATLDPIWAPVQEQAAPLPIDSLLTCLWKQWEMALHPCGRSGKKLRALGLSLVQSQLLWPFEGWTILDFALFPFPSEALLSKQNKTKQKNRANQNCKKKKKKAARCLRTMFVWS